MSLQVPFSTRSAAFNAAPGQTAYPVSWPVLAAGDLTVTLIRGGGRTVLALSTDYMVTNTGQQSGAQVVLNAGSLAGDVILVEGTLSPQRQTEFSSNRNIPSDGLNTDLNALMILVQELRRDVNRTVRRSGEDSSAGTMLLPDAAVSSVIALDANGDVIALPISSLGSGGGGALPLPLPVNEGGTGATDPATARADLGLGALATLSSIDQGHLAAGAVGPSQLAANSVTPAAASLGTLTLVAEAASLNIPPVNPTQGLLWIVAAGGTGAWAGQDNQIAIANGSGGWAFFAPGRTWRVLSFLDQKAYVWNGTSWVSMSAATNVVGRLVSALPVGRNVGGNNRAVVLDGNKVAVWGSGASGKACSWSGRNVLVPEIIPFASPGITSIQQLVAVFGRYFVIDQAGYPWAAGDGSNSALGLGDTAQRIVFTRIPFFFNASITIKKIVATRCQGLDTPTVFFVTNAGNVYSTGFNDANGMRGDGTTTITTTPTQVQTAAAVPLTNVIDISAGSQETSVLALLSTGQVAKWGANGSGQLATGNTTQQVFAVIDGAITQAQQVLACSGVLSATNRGNCYVLLANGTIMGAGDGQNSKLGPNNTGATNSIWVAIATPEPMAKIVGGDGYAGARAAIGLSGKVYFWGGNATGLMGLGNTTDQSALIAPTASWQGSVTDVQIGGAEGSAGAEAAYVLAGGVLYAAGYNTNCNLCDGAGITAASTFAPVNGIDPTAVIASFQIAGTDTLYGPMVLTTDGRLWTGGAGALGELGWEPGTLGISPVMQDVLIRGQRGGQGNPGVTGAKGDAGFQFLFLTAYPAGDPGAGLLGVSTLTPGATGTLAISKTTNDAIAMGLYELQWGASSSAVKGQIAIRDWATPSNFLLLNVTGAVTDLGTYVRIPVQVIAAGGTLINDIRTSLTFTRAGDTSFTGTPTAAQACFARLFA